MDEFLINTSTTGNQTQAAVTGFSGTQFVVVWEDGDGSIKGQMLSPAGGKAGGEFLVNVPGTPGTKRHLPAIAEFTLGLVVAWIEQEPGASPQLKLRTLDGDTLSGPEIQVSSAPVERFVRPALSRLGDGFVVVWADARADQRIRGQRFDLTGAKVGSEFRANTVAGLHREPMVAALTNGNIVVGWRARIPGPLLVHLQIFDPDGNPVGGEQTTALDITDARMAALDGGGFVVAHLRNEMDSVPPEPGFETTLPKASIFDATGVFSGRQFPATADRRVRSSWPTITPLRGGRFALVWAEVNVDVPAGTNVMARIFSATQGGLGQAVQVNTASGGERFSLSAAATDGPAGETLFVVWSDDRGTGGDTSGHAVRGRVLTVPAAGF